MKSFIELNYKKLKLSEELNNVVAQHREAFNLLMKHYEIERQLEHPLVEYARYVLTRGSDEEKKNLVAGIIDKMLVKNEVIGLANN